MKPHKIELFKVHMPESVREPLLQTLFSGFIGQGPRVDEFEKVLSNYIQNPRPLTLNSGTSSIQLALRLAKVGPGDEIITTPMTCTATNMPILAAGAKIVWADIDPLTGNIDPSDVQRKINSRSKAVIAVHWGGYPVDLEELNTIAHSRGLKTIEDAAHSWGAEYKDKKIGNHSDFVIFSLQAIKHVTTVDGGVLFCKNPEDHRRGKLLRWYGIDRETPRKDFRCEEDIAEWGYKFHMNDICATIGIEQFKYLDGIVRKHRENALYYDKALKGIKGVGTIPWKSDRKSAYWLYTIHVQKRDEFKEFMKEKGVMVSSVHARNDTHTAFRSFRSDGLSQLQQFVRTMVCIPVGWWVTSSDREYVADCIRSFSKQI